MLRAVAVCFSAVVRAVGALNRITFGCIAWIQNFVDAMLEVCLTRLELPCSSDCRLVNKYSCSRDKTLQALAVKRTRKKFLVRSRKLSGRKPRPKVQITNSQRLGDIKARILIPDLEKMVNCDLSKARKVVLSFEFTADSEEFSCEDKEAIPCRIESVSLNQSRSVRSESGIHIAHGVTMDNAEDLKEDYSSKASVNLSEKDIPKLNGDAYVNLNENTKYIPQTTDEVSIDLAKKVEGAAQVNDGLLIHLSEKMKNVPQIKDEAAIILDGKINDTLTLKDEVSFNLDGEIEDNFKVKKDISLYFERAEDVPAMKDENSLDANGKVKDASDLEDEVYLNVDAIIEETPEISDKVSLKLDDKSKDYPELNSEVFTNLDDKVMDSSEMAGEVSQNITGEFKDISQLKDEVFVNKSIEDSYEITGEGYTNFDEKVEETPILNGETFINLKGKIDVPEIADQISLNLDEKINATEFSNVVSLKLDEKRNSDEITEHVSLNLDEKIKVPEIPNQLSFNLDEIIKEPEITDQLSLNLDEKIKIPETTNQVSLNLDGKIEDTQVKYDVCVSAILEENNVGTLEGEENVLDKISPQMMGDEVFIMPDICFTSEPLDLSSQTQNKAFKLLSNRDEPENDTFEMPPRLSHDSNETILDENEIGEITCEGEESNAEPDYSYFETYNEDIDPDASKRTCDLMGIGESELCERVERILANELGLKSEPGNSSIEELDDEPNESNEDSDQTECLSQKDMEIKSLSNSEEEVKQTINKNSQKSLSTKTAQDMRSEMEYFDETQNNGSKGKCVLKRKDNFLQKTETSDLSSDISKNDDKIICPFNGKKDFNSDQSFNLVDNTNALDQMVSVCTLNELGKMLLVDSLNMPGNLKLEVSVGPPMSGSEILKNFSFKDDSTTDEIGILESLEDFADHVPAAGNALTFDFSKFPRHSQSEDFETMTESKRAKEIAMYEDLKRTKEEFEKHVFLRDNLIGSLQRVICDKPFQSNTESREAVFSDKTTYASSVEQVEGNYPFEVHSTELSGSFNTKSTEFQPPKHAPNKEKQGANVGILKQNANVKAGFQGLGIKNASFLNPNDESSLKSKYLLEQFESRDENKENQILLKWINRRKIELRQHPFEPLCTSSHSESSPESNTDSSPKQTKTGKKGKRRKQKKSDNKSETATIDTMATKRFDSNLVWDDSGRIVTSRYVYDINTVERAGHEFDYKTATLQYLNQRMLYANRHSNSAPETSAGMSNDKSRSCEGILQKDGTYATLSGDQSRYNFKEHDSKIRDAAAFNAFEATFKPIAAEMYNEEIAKTGSLKPIGELFNVQNLGKKMCPFKEKTLEPTLCDQKKTIITESINKDVIRAETIEEQKGLARKRKSKVMKCGEGEDRAERFTTEKCVTLEIKKEAFESESAQHYSELPEVEQVENEPVTKSATLGTNAKTSGTGKLTRNQSLFKASELYSNSDKSKSDKGQRLSAFKSFDTNVAQRQIMEKSKLEEVESNPSFIEPSTSSIQLKTGKCHSDSQIMYGDTIAHKTPTSCAFASETASTALNGCRKRRQSVIVKNDQAAGNGIASEKDTIADSTSSANPQTSQQIKDLQNMCEIISGAMPQQFAATTGHFPFDTAGKDETGNNPMWYRQPPPYGVLDMYDLEHPTERYEYELLQRAIAESSASENSLAMMLERSECRIIEAMNSGSLADRGEGSSAEASSSLTCSEDKPKETKKSKKKKWKNKKRHFK